MSFDRLSRRQFGGIASWVALAQSPKLVTPTRAKKADHPTGIPAFRAIFYGARLHQRIRSKEPSRKTVEVRRFGTVTPIRMGRSPITATPTPRPTIIIFTGKTFS